MDMLSYVLWFAVGITALTMFLAVRFQSRQTENMRRQTEALERIAASLEKRI